MGQVQSGDTIMLYALEGVLEKKESVLAILNVGGIIFEVNIPLSTYTKLPEENQLCKLFIEMVIGEKMVRLYGFYTINEKSLFNSLRKISKIGPQTALSVLSSLSLEQFYHAISNKDEKILTTVPGIGKKTALSIIVEFASKLPKQEELDGMVYDAIEVLENMGFPKSHSVNVVKTVYEKNKNISLENLIKESLRISKKNVN